MATRSGGYQKMVRLKIFTIKLTHNKRLKRTNIRCHLFCKETQKSRHQTFARLAGRYAQKMSK
jgi:hypothetical protein